MSDPRSRSQQAAERYLAGDKTLRECAEQYGLKISTVYATVVRLREKLRAWPDDEVTC